MLCKGTPSKDDVPSPRIRFQMSLERYLGMKGDGSDEALVGLDRMTLIGWFTPSIPRSR